MQSCFKIPICLCQKHSSKSASLYEGNCFLLTDDLSLVVSFPTHQSSQSDLLQLVHFWVALWHIKTLFGIHTVLLYCLQACSKLFMDIARDRTHELLFFFFFLIRFANGTGNPVAWVKDWKGIFLFEYLWMNGCCDPSSFTYLNKSVGLVANCHYYESCLLWNWVTSSSWGYFRSIYWRVTDKW